MNVPLLSTLLLAVASSALAQKAPPSLEEIAAARWSQMHGDRIIGVTDNQGITLSDIRRQIEPISGQLRASAKSEADFDKLVETVFTEMLNNTADRQLVIAEFRAGTGKLPPSYVDAEIEDTVRREFNGDRNRFVASLRSEGTTPLAYRKIVEDRIIFNEMLREVRTTAAQIGPGKIAEHFEKNKADYIRKEQIRLRQITLTPGAAETVEEAKARADAWADALRHPEKITATFARFKINTTKLNAAPTFGDIAERISTDDYAKKGGDSGWRNVEDLNEKIIGAVKDLPIGQPSAPLQFDVPGSKPIWFIFVREGARPKGFLSLSDPEVLAEVEDKVRTASVEQAVRTWIAELRRKHHVEIR